jgi:hypothetical protein
MKKTNLIKKVNKESSLLNSLEKKLLQMHLLHVSRTKKLKQKNFVSST